MLAHKEQLRNMTRLLFFSLLVLVRVLAQDVENNFLLEVRLRDLVLSSYRLKVESYSNASDVLGVFRDDKGRRKLFTIYIPTDNGHISDGCQSKTRKDLNKWYTLQYSKQKKNLDSFVIALPADNCSFSEKIAVAKSIGAAGLIIFNTQNTYFNEDYALSDPCLVDCRFGAFSDKIECEESSMCPTDLCLATSKDNYCCAKDSVSLMKVDTVYSNQFVKPDLPVFFISTVSGEFLTEYLKQGNLVGKVSGRLIKGRVEVMLNIFRVFFNVCALLVVCLLLPKEASQFENNQLVSERELIKGLKHELKVENRERLVDFYKMNWYKLLRQEQYRKLDFKAISSMMGALISILFCINFLSDRFPYRKLSTLYFLSHLVLTLPVSRFLSKYWENKYLNYLTSFGIVFFTSYSYEYNTLFVSFLIDIELLMTLAWLLKKFKFVCLRDVFFAFGIFSLFALYRSYYNVSLPHLFPIGSKKRSCSSESLIFLPLSVSLFDTKLFFLDLFVITGALSYAIRVDYFKLRADQVAKSETLSNQQIIRKLSYYAHCLVALFVANMFAISLVVSFHFNSSIIIPIGFLGLIAAFLRVTSVKQDFLFLWNTDLHKLEMDLPKMSFFRNVRDVKLEASVEVQSMDNLA